MNYKSFIGPYLGSLGPFGDVIVSMLATITAQDLIKKYHVSLGQEEGRQH